MLHMSSDKIIAAKLQFNCKHLLYGTVFFIQTGNRSIFSVPDF